MFLRTLEACKGSTSKAATILGISPRKIQYKLHEYGRDTGAPRAAPPSERDLGAHDGPKDESEE